MFALQDAKALRKRGDKWEADTLVELAAVSSLLSASASLLLAEGIAQQLQAVAKDLKDFTACLSRARSPAGFLIVKLSDLEKARYGEDMATKLCSQYLYRFQAIAAETGGARARWKQCSHVLCRLTLCTVAQRAIPLALLEPQP